VTRVLVIEPAGNLWGSERALLDLLVFAKNDEFAVCLPPNRPLGDKLRDLGIKMLPYYIYATHEKTKFARLLAAFGVLRACIEFKPDVIYLNQSGAYKVVLPAALLFRLPMVAHIRIYEDVAYLAKSGFFSGTIRPAKRRIGASSGNESSRRNCRRSSPGASNGNVSRP